MKKLFTVLSAFLLLFMLSPVCLAAENGRDYYLDVWNGLDGETKKLMESVGVDADAQSLADISPERVFNAVLSLFSSSAHDAVSGFCTVLAVMLAVSLLMSYGIKTNGLSGAAECIGGVCVMFSLLAVTNTVSETVISAAILTEDFMLGVIPAFSGVIAMSGSPSLALSFNSIVLVFAQCISGGFTSFLPAYTSVVTSVAAAGVINPFFACEKLTALINKIACGIASLVCGVFVAVLSIRGVIAGAADTVTIKGLRFLIGSSVPVVGSAIGDALNSVIASLGLIRHSVAALALTAAVLIALPALIEVTVYKLSMSLLSVLADILSLKKLSGFVDAINGVFSFYAAVLCFNTFVFVISIAIVLTIGK